MRRDPRGRVHAGDGIEYVSRALSAGLDVDSFAGQLSFFFNGHNNFLEEIAKFRAARKLWSSIMHERFAAKTAEARALRFHCQTAGVTLTAQQPLNNVVRVALQALAAVYGGAQSIHTNSYDEALGLPTEEAVTIALRTQQIVAHESGAADIVDPLGGSYAIEAMTSRIEQGARAYFARIDEMGGMVRAIEEGFIQRGNSANGVHLPARHREQAAHRGRRQRVHQREPQGPGAQDRPAHRGRADRPGEEGEGHPRCRRARARASRRTRGRARHQQPGASDPRCCAGVGDRGEISDVLRSFGEYIPGASI